MKIDTLGLQAFVAIAEQAGFQKAADTLHLTQTALTRRLQNFEALLGVKLIERARSSLGGIRTPNLLIRRAIPIVRPVRSGPSGQLG